MSNREMVNIGGTWFRADSVDAVRFTEEERVRGTQTRSRNVHVFLRGNGVVTVRAREEDTEDKILSLLSGNSIPDNVLNLLRDLVDPDDCWFDHHGGCQAHGYLTLEPGEVCPHDEAKRLIADEEVS